MDLARWFTPGCRDSDHVCHTLTVWRGSWVLEGRVVGVCDGDTITVLDAEKKQHKVRIAGIDKPEKAQAFGNAAKENLSVPSRAFELHRLLPWRAPSRPSPA